MWSVSLRLPIAACTMLGWIVVPGAARADDPAVSPPIYELPAGLHRAEPRLGDVRPPIESARTDVSVPLNLTRTESRFAVVELPPDRVLAGQPSKRSHHAIGYRWQAAESWLRDQGFDAQTCYLPMARLHTKLNATGASATLWIYGRCTFK
jgi:hypothetical protein